MANSIRRRDVIRLAASAATLPITRPLALGAQQPNLATIGLLERGRLPPNSPSVQALRAGLAEAGFVDGRNLLIEYRGANGDFRALPGMAADLVRRQVAVIVARNSLGSITSAKNATSTIPIVFDYGGDAVDDGLVASLSRPGGNLTGVMGGGIELAGKRLDLLLKMVPQVKKVGFLSGDRSFGRYEEQATPMLAAGRALGVEIMPVECHSDRDFEAAVAKMVEGEAGAMILANFPFDNLVKVVALAALHKLPAMYPDKYFVQTGGLMSYGRDPISIARHLGSYYVARILNGAKPADLPVERPPPSMLKLAINLKTAKAIGLEVPPQILAISDEVIEYETPRVWNLVPTITVVSRADDPRLPLVSDAVAFWNDTFAQLGTPFRLGAMTQVVEAIPVEDLKKLSSSEWPQLPESLKRIAGNIIVALSESDLLSFTAPQAAPDKVVVAIRDYRSFPLTLPNVARNVIAHELGHAIGLAHNADPTTLMCGRPSACRPDLYVSDHPHYFGLTEAEKADLLRMYPTSWRATR